LVLLLVLLLSQFCCHNSGGHSNRGEVSRRLTVTLTKQRLPVATMVRAIPALVEAVLLFRLLMLAAAAVMAPAWGKAAMAVVVARWW
jgi:hypothetical protein